MALLEQEGGLRKGFTAARAAPRGVRGGTPRGMLPGRGGPRGMMARGMPHGAPAMTNRGVLLIHTELHPRISALSLLIDII